MVESEDEDEDEVCLGERRGAGELRDAATGDGKSGSNGSSNDTSNMSPETEQTDSEVSRSEIVLLEK